MLASSSDDLAARVAQRFGRSRIAALGSLVLAVACARGTPAPAATADPGAGLDLGCNPATGLADPLPACSEQDPCLRPATELGVGVISDPGTAPLCRTSSEGRPFFDDGPPIVWLGIDGTPRHACLFVPTGATQRAPRPLLVWLHGGGSGSADAVYDHTSLRVKAETWDLAGDPRRPGFVLLSVQGRNLHYPTGAARDGRHHDFYFRDLSAPSRNPDVAWIDALVDALVASGAVDPQRIYLMGWSNGGFFAQMYAIARSLAPTPGGHRVAAAVAYTAADPFENTSVGQQPSCQLDPYPRAPVPILLVSRSCDVVACDAAQARSLAARGLVPEPGHVVAPWFDTLRTRVGSAASGWAIVTGLGTIASACTPAALCLPASAVLNHVRWPDGVADGSGVDHEPRMLEFLRSHVAR